MENLELGETLSAIFGKPTELAPGITAYGGEAPEPTPAAPARARYKVDHLDADELRQIAADIAGYIILSHAYVHLPLNDSADELIMDLRGQIRETMHHYAVMLSIYLDRDSRWEMRR